MFNRIWSDSAVIKSSKKKKKIMFTDLLCNYHRDDRHFVNGSIDTLGYI